MPRLGVLGTMVWDTIHPNDAGHGVPVEEWGGIAYALAAADAALPEGWTIFPIAKVGRDVREPADAFFTDLERIDSLDGTVTVPEANNRVELFYHTAGRRCEKLTGGVPGWTVDEVVPLARSCDALYVNFIAGWELELDVALALRDVVDGPIYCDLHSLMLGVGPDGMRSLRPLDSWRKWLSAFDVIQMNEDELVTLASGRDDPWTLASDVVGHGADALLVTLGERGAAWVSTWEFSSGDGEPAGAAVTSPAGTLLSGTVETLDTVANADPTGCGDVWGATCFARLLDGDPLEEAMKAANRAAGRNASYRGASGLNRYLSSPAGHLTGGTTT